MRAHETDQILVSEQYRPEDPVFFFALILWVYVNAKGSTEISYVVPLEYRNLPSSLVISESSADYVDVRIRSREGFQNHSIPQQLSVMVDLSGAQTGEAVYYLGEENIRAPSSVKIRRVSPTLIKVRLEPVATKQVKVVARLIGKPGPGVILKNAEVYPPSVTLEGARSLVGEIQEVDTLPVDVSGAQETFSEKVALRVPSERVRVTEEGPVTVRVVLEKSRR